MIDDDKQIGKTLSRRELLGLMGITGGSLFLLNCSTSVFGNKTPSFDVLPPCVVKPELTEGPYFVDEKLNRSDIRADTKSNVVKEGSPLELEFRVSQITEKACQPLGKAMVDIWHCDANGVYSGVQDWQFNTTGQNFLRGFQTTDEKGVARFSTIYPGWYVGWCVHIHFKIRTDKNYEFTSQLFFDEKLTDKILIDKPYSDKSANRTRNERDGIFRDSENQLTLNLKETEKGHKAIFEIGLYI